MKSLLGTIATATRNALVANKAPVPIGDEPTTWPGYSVGGDNYERYLTSTRSTGTLYQIINRLSVSTAAPGWHMHRTTTGEQTLCPRCNTERGPLVEDHLALRVWSQPNNFFTRQEFFESGQQHQDLAGETWIVIDYFDGTRIPQAMWLVRPDRMEPVPSKTDYLAGYIYKGPKGEKIPLDLDEVIFIRTPDPDDPYRGLGPIPAILRDIDSARFSADYVRNFFLNSAEPGGIIEIPDMLGDQQFEILKKRWNEQHRGVSRAHRVALLEKGKWVDRKYSIKEMDLAGLRNLSRDAIMEAYGVSKFVLGIVDDVNRATADVASTWFAQNLIVPRLERWKQAANRDFLPLFGSTGQGVELCYDDPVPENAEQRNADLTARTAAYHTLIQANVDPADAAEVCGLPQMRTVERETPQPVQEVAA